MYNGIFNVMLGHVLPILVLYWYAEGYWDSNRSRRIIIEQKKRTLMLLYTFTHFGYFWRLGDILCKKEWIFVWDLYRIVYSIIYRDFSCYYTRFLYLILHTENESWVIVFIVVKIIKVRYIGWCSRVNVGWSRLSWNLTQKILNAFLT